MSNKHPAALFRGQLEPQRKHSLGLSPNVAFGFLPPNNVCFLVVCLWLPFNPKTGTGSNIVAALWFPYCAIPMLPLESNPTESTPLNWVVNDFVPVGSPQATKTDRVPANKVFTPGFPLNIQHKHDEHHPDKPTNTPTLQDRFRS